MTTTFSTIYRSSDIQVLCVDASYSGPQRLFDREPFASFSFVVNGSYEYGAGGGRSWVHSNVVLVENGPVEFTLSKPIGQKHDRTLSIRLLSEEARRWTMDVGDTAFFLAERSVGDDLLVDLLLDQTTANDEARTEAAVLGLLTPRCRDRRGPQRVDPHAIRLIDRAKQYMRMHYADPIRLTDLAREACTSLFHFDRSFKRTVGITPYQYLLRVRVEQAARMLLEGLTASACADLCGFSSLGHFSNTFHRLMGVRPSELRKSNLL